MGVVNASNFSARCLSYSRERVKKERNEKMIVRKWLIEQSIGTGLEKLEIVDNLPLTGRGVKTAEIIEKDGIICSIPMEAILTGNGVFTM